MVKINRTISIIKVNEYINGVVNLIPNELILNGKVSWDSTLPVVTNNSSEIKRWETPQQDVAHPPRPQTAFFECPLCKKVDSSTCSAFQYKDLDRKQRCTSCNRTSQVKQWKCVCGTEWQRCAIHRYSTLLAKAPCNEAPANGQPHSAETSTKKRQAINRLVTYDEILAEDVFLGNKEVDQKGQEHGLGEISLGNRKSLSLNPNFLGPILTKRFCGGSRISP